MKTFILNAVVGTGGIVGHQFVKQDGAGGVNANNTAATGIGLANATKLAGDRVGVIKKGLVWVNGAASTAYEFGDVVELHTDGQTVLVGTTNPIGTVAATRTTPATGDMKIQVLLDM